MYNNENVTIILEAKIKYLKIQASTGKNQEEQFGKEIADMVKSGVLSQQDVIDSQDHGIKAGDLIPVFSILNVNKTTGLSYKEAVDTGHKIQFIYLSYHQAHGRTDGMSLFSESMRAHEEGIEAIFHGTYPPDKLAVLNSLPPIEKWDHKLGEKAYSKIF